MTPKEKAKDLVDKHRVLLMNETECGNEILCTSIAIKSAEIAVGEVIEQWDYIDTYIGNLNGQLCPNLIYWYNVKKELLLL